MEHVRVQVYRKDTEAYYKDYICDMDKASLKNYRRLGGKVIPLKGDPYGGDLPQTILNWESQQ